MMLCLFQGREGLYWVTLCRLCNKFCHFLIQQNFFITLQSCIWLRVVRVLENMSCSHVPREWVNIFQQERKKCSLYVSTTFCLTMNFLAAQFQNEHSLWYRSRDLMHDIMSIYDCILLSLIKLILAWLFPKVFKGTEWIE